VAFASEQLVAVLAAIQDSSPPIRESLASLPWRTLRRTVGFVVSSSLSATAVIAPSVNGRRWTTSAIEQSVRGQTILERRLQIKRETVERRRPLHQLVNCRIRKLSFIVALQS
jgi:hypothetical protein